MASALMEADESSLVLENNRIAGLESQVLNSQEIIARLNRELDSALLRITTLENVCSENQNDLHEKRNRIQKLYDEINEREVDIERLKQELIDKDEKLENLDELILQLKQHIKQAKQDEEETESHEFDQELRQLILHDLDDENNSSNSSPQAILYQYQHNQRLKFQNLLQESLTTDDISSLIDSDDILFELLTHLNSLSRLKETLSNDSKQLQHIRSLLHITDDDVIHDLINKRQCIEYLHTKIDNDHNMTDMDLIKHVLHGYFNYQEQQTDLKEYLKLNNDSNDLNYSKILLERSVEAEHVEKQLNERIQNQEQNLEQLRNQLNETDEETQSNLLNLRSTLSNKLSVPDDIETILQRIDDYQLIINTLNPEERQMTNDEFIEKIETMKNAERMIGDLQQRLDETIHEIEQIADEFAPKTNGEDISDITRIRQSLTNFRQKVFDTKEDILQSQSRIDVESQTIDNDDFYQQIKDVIGIEEDNPEEIINKIEELSQLPSKAEIDELFSNNNQLRESVTDINKKFQKLNEEYEELMKKEDNVDRSIERLLKKLGLSSDSSPRTQIDEICAIFDKFCLDYCQLTSTDIEIMNLIEIFKHIPLVIEENNRLKEIINQINFDQSSDDGDDTSKLENYLIQVKTLCQLICNDEANIDQALIMYRTKIEQNEKVSDFKQQLLTRLSIDNEDQIFDRLDEIEELNTNLKDKLKHNDDVSGTVASLNVTVSEQRNKILEQEDTLEKLRAQRERMLGKMKEMKTNNEALADQLKQSNLSRDEFHRKEIDYKNQIEEIEQQLRGATNQIQVTFDECQTQQDLQETMKLEIESLKNEMETQRKLYESRCRQIINEKNQLDKTKKEILEQKQSLEDDNKRLLTILHTIKDTLENVDDVNSIVDTILKLRQDHLILTSELDQNNDKIQKENEKLLSNIHQQQKTIDEYIHTKNDLEKRLIDNEHQINKFKQDIENHIHQYQQLQNEYQLYKEDNQIKKNLQVAVIDIEESPPPPPLVPLQQTTESNDWMAIDIQDEDIPLTTTNKREISIDTPAALFNLLGELKSKLGITLTHRPRSSSVFFLYLCAVHLLTLYLLFIRHC